MAKIRYITTKASQRGFSLIELMASLFILTLVIGVVTRGITEMQTTNAGESKKMDLTQESREFMDQITNDLRQSGFPRPSMFDPRDLIPPAALGKPPDCTRYAKLACGLTYVDATQVLFEGDVDGTGVSEETIQLVQTNGSNNPCTTPPCVIQRGTVPKSTCNLLVSPPTCQAPQFYTEVNNVMNTTVFTAYQNDGTTIGLPAANIQIGGSYNGYNTGANIRAIGITLWVQSQTLDPKTHLYPTVTMVSTARVND
jgi:prepilin-type N-terminal cleavage/methylation domain-containing protein